MTESRVCPVEGCSKPSLRLKSGLCSKHYTRVLNHGSVDIVKKVHSYGGAKCAVEACTRTANDKGGMCEMHAQRVRRHGDPSYVTPESVRIWNNREAQPRLGQAKKSTYPKLFGRHAHRVIAEQMLGRKLKPSEVVHHKDENRQNYNPENLEVLPSQAEHARRHFRRAE